MAIHVKIKDKKPAQIRFHSKRPRVITKKNDNINMNSTIAGSMNARRVLARKVEYVD